MIATALGWMALADRVENRTVGEGGDSPLERLRQRGDLLMLERGAGLIDAEEELIHQGDILGSELY
jgi:hypothetical protein